MIDTKNKIFSDNTSFEWNENKSHRYNYPWNIFIETWKIQLTVASSLWWLFERAPTVLPFYPRMEYFWSTKEKIQQWLDFQVIINILTKYWIFIPFFAKYIYWFLRLILMVHFRQLSFLADLISHLTNIIRLAKTVVSLHLTSHSFWSK